MVKKDKKAENESGQDGGLALEQSASKGPDEDENEDNPPAASLGDIQRQLAGMEERIITSLTAQISANHAAIARHDQTIQTIETSMN